MEKAGITPSSAISIIFALVWSYAIICWLFFVVLDEAHRLTESNEITGDENIIDNEALEKREQKGKKQKDWIQLISSIEKAKRISFLAFQNFLYINVNVENLEFPFPLRRGNPCFMSTNKMD